MSAVGTWQMTMQTPLGEQTPTITINDDGTGSFDSPMGGSDLQNVVVDGDTVTFAADLKTPMGTFSLGFTATADGDTISGEVTTPMGSIPVTGERLT